MRNKIFIILVTVIILISFILISCSNSETSKIGTNTEIQDTSTTQTRIPETTALSKIETTTTRFVPTTTTKQATTTTEQTTTTEEPTTTVQATTTTEQASTTETTITTDNYGPFVGSVNSNVYHYPSCGSAKQIHSENLVVFNSSEEARSYGYRPCKKCNPPG